MGKIFTSQQFVDKFIWLVNKVPNEYYSGSQWLTYDKATGKFRMDCVLSVKGILWNFSGDKNKARGGAIYKANGVPDFTCNGALNYCTDVSTDFSKIVPGAYACMVGTKYNHTGICIKSATATERGKMFECTTGWGTRKCIISEFDIYGNRYYNGVKNVAKWTKHGKLQWVDYSNQPPQPEPKKTIDELAKEVIAGKWGNGEERKRRLTEAGYDYRAVQDRVNELVKEKKYIQLTADVWCRTGGFGFKYPKYKVIPKGTKCELISKNVGKANGYNWDKIVYDGKTVYLPNKWSTYL
jgi:hypothetical protein